MKLWISLPIPFAFALLVCAEDVKTYFPVSKYGGIDTISTLVEGRYSKDLLQMNELSLFSRREDKSQEVYRFMYIPTWGNPCCVAVSKEAEKFYIRFSRLD